MRPFLRTKDFDRSNRFYEARGFEQTLDDEAAIKSSGMSRFLRIATDIEGMSTGPELVRIDVWLGGRIEEADLQYPSEAEIVSEGEFKPPNDDHPPGRE